MWKFDKNNGKGGGGFSINIKFIVIFKCKIIKWK